MMEQVSISAANGKKIKTNGKLVGACFDKKNNKYMSCTKKDGRFVFLGYYNTEIEAHQKYLDYWKEINKNK